MATLEARVAALEAAVASNTASIATHGDSIASNTALVAGNTASITANAASITTNAAENNTFYLLWAGALIFLMQAGFATLSAGSSEWSRSRPFLPRQSPSTYRSPMPEPTRCDRCFSYAVRSKNVKNILLKVRPRPRLETRWACGFLCMTGDAGCALTPSVCAPVVQNLLDACMGALAWYLFGYGFAYDADSGGNGFIGRGSTNFALSGINDKNPGHANGYDWISWQFQFAFVSHALRATDAPMPIHTRSM